MSGTKIYAIDTETTGLAHGTDEVFDIGIVDIATGETWEVHPRPSAEAVDQMHPAAAKVNRYHERTSHPDWWWDSDAVVVHLLHRLFDSREVHIAGLIPWFDARFIEQWCDQRREVDRPQWHYHYIDLEPMVVGYLSAMASVTGLPSLRVTPPYGSDSLSASIGVQPPSEDGRHTALGDAQWAARIYRRIMMPSTFPSADVSDTTPTVS